MVRSTSLFPEPVVPANSAWAPPLSPVGGELKYIFSPFSRMPNGAEGASFDSRRSEDLHFPPTSYVDIESTPSI